MTAADGEKGLNAALNAKPDLILLDIMLPKINGYEICRLIREQKSPCPSSCSPPKATNLTSSSVSTLGADDYVTKPSASKNFARAAAFLRRAKKEAEDVRIWRTWLDLVARRLTRKNKEIELSPKEFSLLEYFVKKPGRVLTRDEILNAVWGRLSSPAAALTGSSPRCAIRSSPTHAPEFHPHHTADRLSLRAARAALSGIAVMVTGQPGKTVGGCCC